MTKPTQAQIEAAAKAIAENAHHQGLKWGEVEPINISKLTEAALTAAAEWPENQIEGGKIKQWPKLGPGPAIRAWNDAIERCAQVADRFATYHTSELACHPAIRHQIELVATAIRALKEKS